MRTTVRWIAVVLAGMTSMIIVAGLGVSGLAIAGLAISGLGETAVAQAPTPAASGKTGPNAGLTADPAQPTQPDDSPTTEPTTADPAEPTQPTEPSQPTQPSEPTQSATSATASPTTPSPTPTATPTTASPTPTPTASPTPVAQRPATPPVAVSQTIPVWSLVIALAVLAIAIAVLVRLSRTTPDRSAYVGPTTITPAEDGSAALVLMSEAGEAMIDSGYDVSSVQSAMDDIAFANGLRHAESIALPTAILVSARIRGQVRTAAVATGHQTLQLHQIEELDEVVSAARRGIATPADASAAIARIRALPPPFSPPLQLLGLVLTSAGLSVLLGASLLGILVCAILGALVGALQLAGSRLPSRYQVLVTVQASFLVALSVFLLSRTGLDFGVLPALVAPLVMLLPGALLTTAVIELATGQMISGAGRLVAGAMQLVLLALGIVAAAALVGIPAIELTKAETPLGPIGPWLAVAVFGVGVVLNRSARMRSLGWILLVLYVAYGAQVVGNIFLGGVLSAFVGAAAMTPVAAIVARQRTGPPAMVSFTPAFWLLVPGALGLVGVTTLLDGDASGLQTLLTTTATMVAIALGVLVGWALTGLFRRMRRPRRPADHVAVPDEPPDRTEGDTLRDTRPE